MGFCVGSPQGSWTLASGSLGPQHLEQPASWCGCGLAHRPTPALPTLGCPRIQRAPEVSDLVLWGTPRAKEATSSFERAHSARGQNPGLARAMGGWIPLAFVLGLGGAQINSARSAQVPLG